MLAFGGRGQPHPILSSVNEVKSTFFADQDKSSLIWTHPGKDHLSLVVLPRPLELAIIEGQKHPDAQKEEGQSQGEAKIASDLAALHPLLQTEAAGLNLLLGSVVDVLDAISQLLGNLVKVLVVHGAPCTSSS